MRRNLYIAAFVAVLLIACIGGFVGGRVLLARLQTDFTPRNETPPVPTAATVIAQTAPTEAPAETPVAAATAPRATATMLVVPAPVTDQPQVLTPGPTWTAGVALPTSEPGLTIETPVEGELATPEPSATPIPDFQFTLARAVRYTNGDCPGTYALGVVNDRNGNPLSGVRLSLVDEYGNAFSAITKPGPGDTGHYDFPMGGPPRRFYMSIVDEAGNALSPRVEILHDLAPQQGNNCRWVDWRRN